MLVLNLLLPVCLLVCPWKLKVAASAQGCLVLLLLLLLHYSFKCLCPDDPQTCLDLAQQTYHPVVDKSTHWPILLVYLKTILPNHLIYYKFKFGQNLPLGNNCLNVSPTPW